MYVIPIRIEFRLWFSKMRENTVSKSTNRHDVMNHIAHHGWPLDRQWNCISPTNEMYGTWIFRASHIELGSAHTQSYNNENIHYKVIRCSKKWRISLYHLCAKTCNIFVCVQASVCDERLCGYVNMMAARYLAYFTKLLTLKTVNHHKIRPIISAREKFPFLSYSFAPLMHFSVCFPFSFI